jgi:hypothetical protein
MRSHAVVTVLIATMLLTASYSRAQSTPSLNLEGQGTVSNSGMCANPVGCPNSFSATLSGQLAGPVTSGELQINFQVAVPVTSTKKDLLPATFGCRTAAGTGTFEATQYRVVFNGQFCSGPGSDEELNGTISIIQNATTADITWATGTLAASGAIHIPAAAGGIPISGPMVVSIVGAVGEIPQFLP